MLNDIIFRIYIKLLNRDGITASDLAEQYELSVRTIYRYLDVLMDAGVPIEKTRGANGGVRIAPSYKIGALYFTRKESDLIINSLSNANNLLNNTELLDAIEKMKALRSNHGGEYFVPDGRLFIDSGVWGRQNDIGEMLPQVERAVNNEKLLQIVYRDRSGAVTDRSVEPHSIVYKEGVWYLYAYCRLRKEFRLFKVSRIVRLAETNESFVRRYVDETALKELLGYEKFSSAEETLLLVSESKRFAVEEWLGVQSIFENNGCLYARAILPNSDETAEKLLTFGDGISVEKPIGLRDRVFAIASKVAESYRK